MKTTTSLLPLNVVLSEFDNSVRETATNDSCDFVSSKRELEIVEAMEWDISDQSGWKEMPLERVLIHRYTMVRLVDAIGNA